MTALTAADLGVQRIDAAGHDFHQYLACLGHGYGQFLQLQRRFGLYGNGGVHGGLTHGVIL
jgi:hypothetical protein